MSAPSMTTSAAFAQDNFDDDRGSSDEIVFTGSFAAAPNCERTA
jgi:hypothetical protein